MARLKKPVIGELNGKAGHIVGRHFENEHYISVRPDKYNVKKKITEVGSKQRFHTATKLAQAVIQYPELKEVWDKSKMPGKRGYNRLITANYKLLRDNLPTTDNIITPKGIPLFFDMIEVSNKGINCSYDLAGKIQPPFWLTFIILFYNPYDAKDGLTSIAIDRKNVLPQYACQFMDNNGEKYLGRSVIKDIANYRKLFRNAILYAAVASTAKGKRGKWWTSTYALDITGFKMKFLYLPHQFSKNKEKPGTATVHNTISKKIKRHQM